MDNLYRRTQILEIVSSEPVLTQAQLRRRLAQRGLRVTQATVSRDIDELGLAKTRAGYRPPGLGSGLVSAPPQPSLGIVLKEFVRDVRKAGNIVVVRTHPGTAHTIGAALDAAQWEEVAGTVAGDDTIFIATEGARQAIRLRRKLMDQLAE
jgi:transcriptional regulator of arginine metabolism